MYILNNLTSRAISTAVVILGISIGYAIYKSDKGPEPLAIKTDRPTLAEAGIDILEGTPWATTATTSPNFLPGTVTSLLGQEVFSAFVKIKNAGGEINDTYVDQVSKAFSDAIEHTPFAELKEYTKSDLSIRYGATKADWQNFYNSLKLVTSKFANTFSVMKKRNSSIQNPTEKDLFNQILESSSLYKKLASDLALINVPEKATEGFLDLINSYSLSASGLAEAKYYSSDPIRTGAGIKLHEQAATLELIAIEELKVALKSSDIIFSLTPMSSQ